jgi:hypothetical protein
VPSSPLPRQHPRGPRRLHPPRPARSFFTVQARRGCSDLGAPPTPGPAGGWEGAGVRGGALLPPPRSGPQHWAAAAPTPPLPHTPSRPSLPAGDPGRRRQRTDGARRQLSVRSPAGRGRGGGWGRGGGEGTQFPRLGRAVERGKERGIVAIPVARAW